MLCESRPGFQASRRKQREPPVPGPAQGKQWGVGGGGRLRVGMAAQIPIVATPSTPGIARNSKKRPASPSHNGSSAGGYSASKKKKVSASSFAQVRCHSPTLRLRGAVPAGVRAHARGPGGGPSECACACAGQSGGGAHAPGFAVALVW